MEGNSILLPLDAPSPETVARTLADSFGQERACDIYCEIARASYAAAKAVRGVRTVLSYLPNSRYPDLRWLDDEDPGFLAQKGASEKSAPVLLRLVTAVASRFGVVVSEEVAAKAVPVVGAASGSLINVLFIDHFQDMARGHFIVKRLEQRHGMAMVREAYQSLAMPMK